MKQNIKYHSKGIEIKYHKIKRKKETETGEEVPLTRGGNRTFKNNPRIKVVLNKLDVTS